MLLFFSFSTPPILPLLQNIEGVSSKQVVQLTPDQEGSGHPLGPASLVLSPHNIWLSSVGRDGLVRVRETSAMVVQAASLQYSEPPPPPPPPLTHTLSFSFTLLLPLLRSSTSSCSATRTAAVE